ncbi:MAG: hypothetical protein ACOCWW_03815 [Bacteroidota bacterium]
MCFGCKQKSNNDIVFNDLETYKIINDIYENDSIFLIPTPLNPCYWEDSNKIVINNVHFKNLTEFSDYSLYITDSVWDRSMLSDNIILLDTNFKFDNIDTELSGKEIYSITPPLKSTDGGNYALVKEDVFDGIASSNMTYRIFIKKKGKWVLYHEL